MILTASRGNLRRGQHACLWRRFPLRANYVSPFFQNRGIRTVLLPFAHKTNPDWRPYLWAAHPWPIAIAFLLPVGVYAYLELSEPVRHTFLAITRCLRIGRATILSMIDYKRTLSVPFNSKEDEDSAYSQCHIRSSVSLGCSLPQRPYLKAQLY